MKSFKFIFIIIFVLNCSLIFAQKKPNVILILTDDQGWGDLSLHGNPWLETPNLDKLAKTGGRFNNCYVTPLCAPSRASILTGRNHLKTGVISVSRGLEIMNTEENTLAEMFKSNGYKTGIFGKWHNGEHFPHRPNDQGFDEFLGFYGGYLPNYFNSTLDHNTKRLKTQGYIADVLTDAASKFISTNKEKPFFCYIPYNTPHAPHQVPDKYYEKYKAKNLESELATIYGMVENIDDNVGRILKTLKDNKLEENTIIIFMTDNGPNSIRFNGEMRGIKGSLHEGGIRVPFFVNWKNHIAENKIIQTPVAHIDIYPTLKDLCQLKDNAKKPIEGVSLSSLLFQDKDTLMVDRKIFTHVNFMNLPLTANLGGFRSDKHRFIYENNKPQLYDLKKDPTEKNDISQQNSTLTNQYLQEYNQWFTESTLDLKVNKPTLITKLGVELPVFESTYTSGIKLKEGHGWSYDWVEKWNSTKDSLIWEIDCQTPGNYIVEMEYLCKKPDVGSRIACSIGDVKKEVILKTDFYSNQVPSPDRVKRKEVYEMSEWGILKLGSFKITMGKQLVKLKALSLANLNVAEVKGLKIRFEK